MVQEILTAAKTFAGEAFAAAAEETLEAFCRAASDYWRGRLRSGLTPEECSGFVAACAWHALAGYWLLEGAGTAASFTAGDVSVTLDRQSRERAAHQLRQQAECLMIPYLEGDSDFAFRGVRG